MKRIDFDLFEQLTRKGLAPHCPNCGGNIVANGWTRHMHCENGPADDCLETSSTDIVLCEGDAS